MKIFNVKYESNTFTVFADTTEEVKEILIKRSNECFEKSKGFFTDTKGIFKFKYNDNEVYTVDIKYQDIRKGILLW